MARAWVSSITNLGWVCCSSVGPDVRVRFQGGTWWCLSALDLLLVTLSYTVADPFAAPLWAQMSG
jgi:hypothetical protein